MKKRMKKDIRARPLEGFRRRAVFWLLAVLASGVLVLPTVFDTVSNMRQIGSAGTFRDEVSAMTQEQIAAEKKKVRIYNRKIYQYQMLNGFHYRGQNVTDREYESLLSGKDAAGNNIMAYLEIPEIRVYLPVGHGTGEELLQYAAGHMYGSSLPLGGKNTNAILTGHSGLSTARLFTDVKKLKKGDEVRIHVLDEIHRYKVTAKNEVQQGTAEAACLQMKTGKDEMTLYTCSPFGVNDHRTILRLERAWPDISASEGESRQMLQRLSADSLLRLLLCAALPCGLIVLSWILRLMRKRRFRS